MTTKFTPGPWVTAGPGRGTVWHDGGAGDDVDICEVNVILAFNGRSFEELREMREANATLIAAAPQMLAALEAAVRELNEIRARDGVPRTHQGFRSSVTPEHFSSVVDDCFAAIAAARGGA